MERSRDTYEISVTRATLRAETVLSADDLARIAGLSPAGLARVIRLGLIEPTAPGGAEFSAQTATRLRRMMRLHLDLGVNLAGASIIVELLERLDALESRARG